MIQNATYNQYDVIIIGAGPAGCTSSILLARQGHRVLLLERETFPRYRVGESLIPYCYYTLERLGLINDLNDRFQKKFSVQFVTPKGKVTAPFYFIKHMDHASATTWQVDREEFDQLLVDRAVEAGVEVRMGINARKLVRGIDAPEVKTAFEEDGFNINDDQVIGVNCDQNGSKLSFHAPMTIDASGRDIFSQKQNDWRIDDPVLRKVAVWTYYKGAIRDPGMDEGATTVAYVPEKGWFWYLPLAKDMVSVGIVAEKDYLYRDMDKRTPQAIFERELESNSWIKEHVEAGEQVGEHKVTGDYSYRSRHCSEDGLLLTGDAFSFLDPVFSSGVFLALRGGELAADTVHQALKNKNVNADVFTNYGETVCQGIEAMRKLVYAFYDEQFSWADLFKKHPDLRPDATDCLIGHVFRDFDALWSAVKEFASLPDELPHGKPKATEEPELASM